MLVNFFSPTSVASSRLSHFLPKMQLTPSFFSLIPLLAALPGLEGRGVGRRRRWCWGGGDSISCVYVSLSHCFLLTLMEGHD